MVLLGVYDPSSHATAGQPSGTDLEIHSLAELEEGRRRSRSARPTVNKKPRKSERSPHNAEKHVPTHKDTADKIKVEPWKDGQYLHYLEPAKIDPWLGVKTRVDKHDDEMCKGWTDDVDTMLVFTGLFSAIVTAFSVESFKLLSQDPADTANSILLAISQQLSNNSAPSANESNYVPETKDVQINVLYFLSLVLALSVSSVCILAKQWIREYQRDIAVSACDAVRVRQARFDALHAWKVPQILAALPVILQAALLLFFAGLLNQLWNANNHTPAIVVSIIVGMTVLLVVVTTVAPSHWSREKLANNFVPFRSPQAWFYLVVYQRVRKLMGLASSFSLVASWPEFDAEILSKETSDLFLLEITSFHRALRWVYQILRNGSDIEKLLYWCMQPQHLHEELSGRLAHIGRYVATGKSAAFDSVADTEHGVLYELSVGIGVDPISQERGRFQVELLVRSANEAIDDATNWGRQEMVTLYQGVAEICYRLSRRHHVVSPTSSEEEIQYQGPLQDQAALVLDRYLAAIHNNCDNDVLVRLPWHAPLNLLLGLVSYASADVSRAVTADSIIRQTLPAIFRSRGSTSLLCKVAEDLSKVAGGAAWLADAKLRVFRELDEVFVGICVGEKTSQDPTWLEDRQTWVRLRRSIVEHDNMWTVDDPVKHPGFPENYFHDIHPCAMLDELLPRTKF